MLPAALANKYLYGLCEEFAAALQMLTGADVLAATTYENDNRQEVHFVIELPGGLHFDASGLVTDEEVKERYHLDNISWEKPSLSLFPQLSSQETLEHARTLLTTLNRKG